MLTHPKQFFPGGAPAYVAEEPVHPHALYCAQLSDALELHQEYLLTSLDAAPQSTFSHEQRKTLEGIATLTHLLESNCAVVAPAPSLYAGENPQLDMDPRRALLAFMASALPQSHPDFEDVLGNPEAYVDGIHMTPETHFVGEHASVGMVLANVPGTVGDVKTRITWVQVPRDGGGVQLELVHRVGGHEDSFASCSPAAVRSRDGTQLVRGNGVCCASPPRHQRRRLGERLANAHPWSRYASLSSRVTTTHATKHRLGAAPPSCCLHSIWVISALVRLSTQGRVQGEASSRKGHRRPQEVQVEGHVCPHSAKGQGSYCRTCYVLCLPLGYQ